MSTRKKPPAKRYPPAPTRLTAKQKAGMAVLVKTGQLEPLLRDLLTHLEAAENKH
jgi:hypothetical protein